MLIPRAPHLLLDAPASLEIMDIKMSVVYMLKMCAFHFPIPVLPNLVVPSCSAAFTFRDLLSGKPGEWFHDTFTCTGRGVLCVPKEVKVSNAALEGS